MVCTSFKKHFLFNLKLIEYSQTCIQRSPLGQSKNYVNLRQVEPDFQLMPKMIYVLYLKSLLLEKCLLLCIALMFS